MNRAGLIADRLHRVNANFDDEISALEARRHEILAHYLDDLAVNAAMAFWMDERRLSNSQEFLAVIRKRLDAEIRWDERVDVNELFEALQFASNALDRHLVRFRDVAFGGAPS